MNFRKPTAPQSFHDAPAEGPAIVFTIKMTLPTGETKTAYGSALLGPGRDYLTREDALTAKIETDTIATEVSEQYETISALVADFPDASLDPTAKRLLAVERQRDGYLAEVAAWGARLADAGVEPCDRCGGAGGWRGWPGFTCYGCGGSGVEEKTARGTE